MPWFLYHAFKQLFPTGRWFPFFTFMSGLGIAVGVALMLVTSSIMGGFGHQIRSMIVDSEGEVQVLSRTGTIANADAVIARVKELPVVVGATPTATGPVMIRRGEKYAYPALLGVDLRSVSEVFDLQRFLYVGSLHDLDDDSILLSEEIARSLEARAFEEVELYSPVALQQTLSNTDEYHLPDVVRVGGLFQIGHPQLDRSLVICTLRRMQDLYGLENDVHRINIRLRSGADEFVAAAQIGAVLPPDLRAVTWVEAHGDFQSIVRFEKYMVFFLLGFIVVVAALSIMSSLLISVVRKTREIGLLSAVGARARDVALSFCVQGLLLGIVGTAAGFGIGSLVLYFRNGIMRFVANIVASEEAFHVIYGFVNLPARAETRDIIAIVVGSILCSAFAGLIPAWRAARLKPVEALRSE